MVVLLAHKDQASPPKPRKCFKKCKYETHPKLRINY